MRECYLDFLDRPRALRFRGLLPGIIEESTGDRYRRNVMSYPPRPRRFLERAEYRYNWNAQASSATLRRCSTAGNVSSSHRPVRLDGVIRSPNDSRSRDWGGPITNEGAAVKCTTRSRRADHPRRRDRVVGDGRRPRSLTRMREEWSNVSLRDPRGARQLHRGLALGSAKRTPHHAVQGKRQHAAHLRTTAYGKSCRYSRRMPGKQSRPLGARGSVAARRLYAAPSRNVLSFDGGARWQRSAHFPRAGDRLKVPPQRPPPHRRRAFWILDAVTPLHQFGDQCEGAFSLQPREVPPRASRGMRRASERIRRTARCLLFSPRSRTARRR